MNRYDVVCKILDDVLQDNHKEIDINNCIITEDGEPTYVECFYTFSDESHYNPNSIRTFGDGFVDALVDGFIGRFSGEYPSLENFYLSRYEIKARIISELVGEKKQTDAKVEVEIGIKPPKGKEILFSDIDVSLVKASIKVVRNAIQFMINCEEAVRTIKMCLQDAKQSGRVELVDKYTSYLTELVQITSYEKIFN